MKRLVQGGALAVVLVGIATVTAQSPAADVTFRGLIDAKNIGEYMRVMAARPHHLGSPYGKQNAEWILARFKEWGWDAKIESYDVLFPTPKERVLELLGPTPFKAALQEPPVAVDPTSSQQSEQLPSFNAYSVDGDVTGPLVYVNYGRPSDYEELARRGISVKGAIVIARYGQSWRGIKPKVAAEHGAIGCLIYSDPRDDGFYVDGVFPDGPMRNRDGVQRGSVMDMPTYPGDPLTPNVGATASAKRLDIKARDHADEDPGAADLVRRCAAAAHGAWRPGRYRRLAWRTADHVSLRAQLGSCASEAGVRLEPQAREQRHRAAAGIDVSRRVDHPRQSSRRLGEWRAGSRQRHVGGARGSARAGRAGQTWMAAQANDCLCRVGRRGARAARLDRMGRGPRAGAARQSGRLHQHRRQRPRLPQRRRLARARRVRQQCRARYRRS